MKKNKEKQGYWKGKKFSEIHKKNIGKALKNRKITWGDKISKVLTGKKKTKRHKENIRLSLMGRKQSKETIEKRMRKVAPKLRGLKRDEKAKRNISEGTRRGMKNVDMSAIVLKNYTDNPDIKKKISESVRKRFEEDPSYREKIRQKRLLQILPTKDTSIEIKMQEILKKAKIQFETHKSILGQPDIFIKPNICIFCDGDYWHNYPEGRDKDKIINKKLTKQGYKVLRFWEKDINTNIIKCFNKINQSIDKKI